MTQNAEDATSGLKAGPLPLPLASSPESPRGLESPSTPPRGLPRTNFERSVNRPRAQEEIPTRPVAIRNFCIACQGGGNPRKGELRDAIRDCTSPACWLFPHRAGTATRPGDGYYYDLPSRRREPDQVPSLSTAIRAQCRECCGWDADGHQSLAANVEACPARECWLWPWRSGALLADELEGERVKQMVVDHQHPCPPAAS